ncbi:hypothetical protein [Halomarina pelagica]|uniref:hypothetical protein n=1 Tax=Halomarina pelagica TaxID=2961599 RepID=UPI0020C29631|nr:hypothetical protein [Halomarina sp. BND7]
MPESDSTAHAGTESERPTGGRPPLTRYDALLLAVPVAFAAALLVAEAFAVPSDRALLGASVVAAAVVGDGLFRNPPRPTPTR